MRRAAEFNSDEAFKDTNYNIKNGSFDLIAYNTDGKEIARKTIAITPITTMNDIIQAINANTDDNQDNNTENDFDDYFTASFNNETKKFVIQPKNASQGLFVSMKDNGTNFMGALKLNPFFKAMTLLISAWIKNTKRAYHYPPMACPH